MNTYTLTLKHTLVRIFAVVSVLVLVFIGQAQAFTSNDYYCVKQGGTCWYDPNDACSTDGASDANVAVPAGGNHDENVKAVYAYLTAEGLTPAQAAGILGNLDYESGINPKKIEGAVGGGESENPDDAGRGGYGIAQFTPGSKLKSIVAAASIPGEVYTLDTQIKALWAQLDGKAGSWNETQAGQEIKSTSNIEDATRAFQGDNKAGGKYFGYERPQDEAGSIARRIALARADLTIAGGSVSSPAAGGDATVTPSSSDSACCPPTVTANPASVDAGSPSDWQKLYTGATKSMTDTLARGHISPKILVIHFTVSDSEGADLLRYFANQGGSTGVQFNIGKTGTVYQYFPLNDMQKANHVGDANSKSIGIEITGHDVRDLLADDKQFESVVSTVKFLCDKYNIPCSNPKGIMTGDDLSSAQGLLGHNETPTNDHQDPDADVSADGKTSYNHNTHARWTAADARDSRQHVYMIKLRTALGFDPTPGKSGGAPTGTDTPTTIPVVDQSSASSTCASVTADTATGSGTDKDPVGDGPNRSLAYEAVKYDTKTNNGKYTYKMGGLHGPLSQLQAFASSGGEADCSGFVRYIIWKVYGYDVGSFVTQDLPHNSNFEEVKAPDVAAGDIGWREEHVDFITQNRGGGQLHQFGAHSTDTDLYGADTKASSYTKFYRYIGPKGTAPAQPDSTIKV